jgi:cytochrome c oxidase cbb3-type subunit III
MRSPRKEREFLISSDPTARGLNRFAWLVCALILVAILTPVGSHGQEGDNPRYATANPMGRQVFSSNCSSCHGLDGRGGERAPDIATKTAVQHLPDAALFRIITEGVSGTGMPAFRSLGKPRVDATVRYLRDLQGRGASAALPGDPSKGEVLFFGKAECSHCHTVRGSGGFMGSDLSTYADTKSAAEIYNEITRPTAGKNRVSDIVTATTSDGKKLTGLARNEDNFSLQLQTMDGAFYSFAKSDLREVQRSNQPLMPTDYVSRLNRTELDDLVSYLMKVARSSSSSSGSATGYRPKPVKTVE